MREILSKLLVGYFMLCGVYGLSADNWSLQSAEEAYTSGDFQTAVAHWRGLAELGDVVAMNNLGYAYEKGLAVAQSDSDALGWYIEAANKGFATAMFNVGEAIYEERGVTDDKTEALKWLILAGSRGDSDARDLAAKIAEDLNADEVKSAIRRANNWRPPQ